MSGITAVECKDALPEPMRMFRSFLLRLAMILSLTGTVCLFLMAVTLGLQGDPEGMKFLFILFGLLACWLIVNAVVVRKSDPELSVEVARLILPGGALLSIMLSFYLALVLEGMITEGQGREHFILFFVGPGVAIFLAIRFLDIKWLRGEEEILALESISNQKNEGG